MSTVPALVLLAALALLLARAVLLTRRWRVGLAGQQALLPGLLQFPRRYFHDIHNVVSREPRSARMHARLAGGFLGALIFLGLPQLLGAGSFWTGILGLVGVAIALAGLTLQARRRWPARPARYSAGPFVALTPAFAAALAFLLWLAVMQIAGPVPTTLTLLLSLVGLAGLGLLAWQVMGGPMRHVVAGTAWVSTHTRPARFDVRSTDLRALDLGGSPESSLGAQKVSDFTWSQLASFDACIQCGRCESVCPAFAAGQPLNPKKLINDLSNALSPAGAPLAYAGSPHPGVTPATTAAGPESPIVISQGTAGIAPETLWSCTTCRACVEECPMLIEHVDAIAELRRFQTLELGAAPGKAGEALDNLRLTDTAGGRSLSSRLDWAADLGIPLMAGKGEADILLWLGEAAYDLRNQRSLRAFVRLLKLAQADFATLGPEERDTGDLARRLGDEATFQRLARDNVATLGKYRFTQIVTLDPHVLHSLRNEYPAMGGQWTVRHHSDLLRELLEAGRLQVTAPVTEKVTYHDPCYLGRYNGEFEAPRALLKAAGATLIEMERSGSRSSCCGGGGGAPLTDIPGKRRIPDVRMDHAKATGASVLAVGCPFCAQMLEGVTGERTEVRDIAEILLDAVEGGR